MSETSRGWARARPVAMVAAILAASLAAVPALAGDEGTEIALSLRGAVVQALRGSPLLTAARLDRELHGYDLREARARFDPEWRLGTSVAQYGYRQGPGEQDLRLSAGPGVEMLLPTGGRIEAGPTWERVFGSDGRESTHTGLSARVTQPLARGAGSDLARAPVVLADLVEEERVLALRARVSRVVTEVGVAYRALIRAALQIEIERRSLAQAIASRDVVQSLIRAGRIARSELTQSESSVAERELALVRSEEALEEAQAALAVILGVQAGVRIQATERLEVPERELLGEAASLERALANDPGYRGAEIAVRRAAIVEREAHDAARWDVSLEAEARWSGAGVGDLARQIDSDGTYGLGLSVTIPFGGAHERRIERQMAAARIGRMKAEWGRETARRELEIELRGATTAVRSRARGIQLAKQALELARRTEAIEERRLRRGITSSYRMGQIRDDLARAETAELNARIDYLDAVGALDRIEGTVLEGWGIVIDDVTGEAAMETATRTDGEPGGAAGD